MSADVAIYGTVGGLLIGTVLILLIVFLMKKCKERREINRASRLDQETISIHSATSKDNLIYGSRGKTDNGGAIAPQGNPGRTAMVNQAPPPSTVCAAMQPKQNQPVSDSDSDRRSSRRGSLSSSSVVSGRESLDLAGGDSVDNATKFLVRRQSQDCMALSKTIGSIQPDLYTKRGSLVTSMGASSNSASGKVLLKFRYDFSKSDFIVTVAGTTGLPTSIHEYFYRIFLEPEIDNKSRQTSTWKRSQKEALKEETFKFPLTYEEVMERRLIVKLLETGKLLGRHPVISGEVELELGDMDPSAGVEIWADIQPKKQSQIYGEVLFSLSYLQSVQRLTVTIHKAKDLKKMDISGSSDPYVKVSILQDGKAVKKRKTSIRKKTLSPVWNEALDFNLPDGALKKSQLELIIMDHDRIGNDEPLGQILIGSESSDQRAKRLWQDLVESKSTPPVWLTVHCCDSSHRRNSAES